MASKEIIKENVVSAPTLFIGVGGTGCSIVKGVAEKCRGSEKDNINFVCLDTNVNDLLSVTDSESHIYTVQTSNTQTVGNYLDYDEDALRNWFPKNAVLYDKTVSEGAGQVRAISRLAFNACVKTGKLTPLTDAIDALFRKDGKAMKQALRIVFASTSSGGTGSGLLLPLSMYVRDYVNRKYPNTSLIVRALILLPETLDSVITSSVERESQRRNAYATIKEINAFMIKGSGFFDIDESLKRYRDLHVDVTIPGTNELKSLSLLPFDFCFLLDGQDAEDTTLISKGQYVAQAAQALYEQNIGPMQSGAFSIEDNIIKELSNNHGRNRFGGIGASVLRYPYEDIVDYIACNWAMNSIGGEGEAAKWSRYDKRYEILKREEQKRGLSESERTKLAQFYVDALRGGKDNFSKDINSRYLGDGDNRVLTYIEEVCSEAVSQFINTPSVRDQRASAEKLSHEIDYSDVENRDKASSNYKTLSNYEQEVRKSAQKLAERSAEAIVISEKLAIQENSPFSLEKLMKNGYGEVSHPNGMRWLLYAAQLEIGQMIEDLNGQKDVFRRTMESFGPKADDDRFDNPGTKKSNERSLKALCDSEKADPTIWEKMGGIEKMYDTLNECFPQYYNAIENYGSTIVKLEVLNVAYSYIKDLNAELERFYRTFSDKILELQRHQEDLVNALAFEKGDSVLNICAAKPLLDELALMTGRERAESDMLDPELNAQLFDAIKNNVAFERETRDLDFVEDDRSVDLFNDILLGYFKKTVENKCDNIDLNIIDAIAMENRMRLRIKARKESGNAKVIDSVTKDQNIRYILEVIAKGQRLAAPGISRTVNEEPREIRLCSFNKSLLNMRTFDVEALMPNGKGVETISKYELHFFDAMYNLTPDKLSKFAAAKTTETGAKGAGLYHNAYTSYARKIGPDSTKSMISSTHIDKRWDSIAVMPELDFAYQQKCVTKIHKALIYALIHKNISYRDLSRAATGKKVYKYEDTDEREVDLIVSNGTLCDEFYEVLDSLYLSASIVNNIESGKLMRRAKDIVRNSEYRNTEFKKDLAALKVPSAHSHEGVCSIFEIPLMYFNTLPNNMRYNTEISDLVNAAIDVLREETLTWESPNDAKFVLCEEIAQQFQLLMDNYRKYPQLNRNVPAGDNKVIDLIFRKIRSVISCTPEPADYEAYMDNLKKQIAGNE